jgi:hypothetical protein
MASLGLHELSPISLHPPLGERLGQGSRHPARGTINNPWAPRGVSSLGILAGYAHTLSVERRVQTLCRRSWQCVYAAEMAGNCLLALLRLCVSIIHGYMYGHVSKCAVATTMLFKVKLISSMPDHATQEAGIASRCEPMPNLLGQSTI